MRISKPLLKSVGGLMVAGALLVGCAEQRATRTIALTQDTVAELERLEASRYAEADFTSLRNTLSQANQQVASSPSDALATARQARTQADDLLNRVLPQAASDARQAAIRAIEVADRNQGRQQDPGLFEQIQQLRIAMDQAQADNNFNAVIQNSVQIQTSVDRLVAGLKSRAETARINAENVLQQLRGLNSARWAPEPEASTQRLITAGAAAMADDVRDFITAEQRFSEARAEATAGITLVRRNRSDFFIDGIERALAEAFEEGATTYMPAEYNRMVSDLERQIADFNNELYEQVESAVEPMLARAEQLKLDVKERRSDANLAEIRRGIDTLVEGGAREYLPGRVEVVEQMLVEGQRIRSVPAGASAADREAAFDEIRRLHERAMDQLANVNAAFARQATEALRLAGNQIDTTTSVYEQVQGIFEPIADVPADMRPFDDARRARRTQLGAELSAARAALAEAREALDRNAYRDAILGAEEQGRVANNILGEIYRFVAGNAAIELSNLIAGFERNGARVYAPRELEQSQRELQRLKEIIQTGDFLLATEVAGAARANVELMAQRIAGRAVVDIQDARTLLTEFDTPRVRQFAAAELEQARGLIRQAESAVTAERLQSAVEDAQEAIRLVMQARDAAAQAGAERALQSAVQGISAAEAGGAAAFAGAELDRARRLLASANSLAAARDWPRVEELALSSARASSDALYARVLIAESQIEEARALGAWEGHRDSLSRAVSLAREARQAIDAGRSVDDANRVADNAASVAGGVVRDARRSNYREMVRRIRRNLDEGRVQGVNYMQPDEARSILRRLAEIEGEWSLDRYEPIMAELREIEADLRGTLEATPEVVETVVAQQTERLRFFNDEGAAVYAADLMRRAHDNLRVAPLEFANGNFRAAHRRLMEAVRALDEVEARYEHEHYVDEIIALYQDFTTAQQQLSNILRLSADEMKTIAFDSMARDRIMAMSGPITISEFRREMDRLYTEALLTPYPARMRDVHESVLESFNRARLSAAHFEKMIIMNLASEQEAARLVGAAYAEMNEANRIAEALKREFFSKENRFRLVQARP